MDEGSSALSMWQLILLAERPVKVGDWVSPGGIEGDVRRINVRATEIQMSDHSTVIVPNSEFITNVVRNVTLADPLGLVQVKTEFHSCLQNGSLSRRPTERRVRSPTIEKFIAAENRHGRMPDPNDGKLHAPFEGKDSASKSPD